ncbi:MAG: BCCT family transporter [Holophagales bacterium]|nr:BCCT family transporter [Holophagales bacterium]MYF95417.1 BCCT family transporter [Holophagales bacterium]
MSRRPQVRVGQDNITPFGLDIHHPVFVVSGAVIVLFVLGTLVFQSQAARFFSWLLPAIIGAFDWFFLSAGNVFVLFALLLVFLPVGRVRLGGPDAKPEFSYPGWLGMLFAAGMGIGLMYFGVSEPLSHFGAAIDGPVMDGGLRSDAAPLAGAAGDALAARDLAMAATIYHWGLHPWAIYAVVGLALAFFAYNHGLPLTLRSAFYPILGDRVRGWWGHLIDVLAVFATLFGLATSLGLGTTQALAGFNLLYGWGTGGLAAVVLIGVITLLAVVSVVRGLDGGIKVLSGVNMTLALALLLAVVVIGPTGEILVTAARGALAYGANFVPLAMPFGREDTGFSHDWTTFYWAWWVSWSPFVGMFIARVSRGRTVREFVVCVTLIPTLLSIVWMAAFGGTAISQTIADSTAPVASAAQEVMLFRMVEQFPLSAVLSLAGIVLVLVFFVTSSDSGSLVVDTITAGGKEDVPTSQRVFWATLEGVVAAVLLLVGGTGALDALRAMTVSTGLPFTLVLLAMCYSIWVGLWAAVREKRGV